MLHMLETEIKRGNTFAALLLFFLPCKTENFRVHVNGIKFHVTLQELNI